MAEVSLASYKNLKCRDQLRSGLIYVLHRTDFLAAQLNDVHSINRKKPMSLKSLSPTLVKLLAATLVFAGTVAYAAAGFVVTAAQEKQIVTGMSRADVRAALGRPAHNLKYRNEPGRTWTYGVVGNGVSDQQVFDVDFSSDGKVLSTDERIEHFSDSGAMQ
jgi:outer membrane protein assembly factor BamE (lipoprotein component of BamABCDE complex)